MEITNRNDLRVGDIATFTYNGHEFSGPLWAEGGEEFNIGCTVVRLGSGEWTSDLDFVRATREMPALPTEPGAVILVSECRGERLDPPVPAACDGAGEWRTSGPEIDGSVWHRPEHITAWTPAKVVPA